MKKYIQNFIKYQPLLSELVSRDIKTKYRRSILGVLWTLLNPLLMMIVLSFVFANLFRFTDIENYSLYLLSGQVVFNFFSESTSSAMSAIVNNAPLIKKVYIPKYLFVIARIASSVINLMASFTALILVMIVTHAELHFTIFLVVIPIAILVVFSAGVGLILASVVVKFRDMIHLYGVLTTVLMYLTPVIYPISQLPEKVAMVVNLNPITGMLSIFRDLVLYNTVPSIGRFLGSGIIAVIVFVMGLYVFYKQQDKFILNI